MRVVAMALLLLAGCTSEAEKAEQQLAMIETANGSGDELCDAKRKVAQAQLESGNQERYSTAKLSADVTCSRAEMDPAYAKLGEHSDEIMAKYDMDNLTEFPSQ